MIQKKLDQLKQEYKNLFKNVWELGGGYGFRLNHKIQVMNYCQKIVKYPRFKEQKINKDQASELTQFYNSPTPFLRSPN